MTEQEAKEKANQADKEGIGLFCPLLRDTCKGMDCVSFVRAKIWNRLKGLGRYYYSRSSKGSREEQMREFDEKEKKAYLIEPPYCDNSSIRRNAK